MEDRQVKGTLILIGVLFFLWVIMSLYFIDANTNLQTQITNLKYDINKTSETINNNYHELGSALQNHKYVIELIGKHTGVLEKETTK